jgi:hypothetical protein
MEDAADSLQAADNLAVLARLEPLLDDLGRRLGLRRMPLNTEFIRVAGAPQLFGISTRGCSTCSWSSASSVVHEGGDKLRVRRADVEKLDRFAIGPPQEFGRRRAPD